MCDNHCEDEYQDNIIETICEGCDDENCIHCVFKDEVFENMIKEKSINFFLNFRQTAYDFGICIDRNFSSVDVENFVNEKEKK